MPGTKVKVLVGRNAGEEGVIRDYNPNWDTYMIKQESSMFSFGFTEMLYDIDFELIEEETKTGSGLIGRAYCGIDSSYTNVPYPTFKNTRCFHKWKETKLVFSSVYDCELCGKKREELDEEFPF
jgi:hypothetical protein